MPMLNHDQLHKLTEECNQAIAAEYRLFGWQDAPTLTPGVVRVLIPLLERAMLPPRWDDSRKPPAASAAPQPPKVRRTTRGRKMGEAERQRRSESMKRVLAAKRAAREAEAAASANGFRPEE
jgi:hypothetical protein